MVEKSEIYFSWHRSASKNNEDLTPSFHQNLDCFSSNTMISPRRFPLSRLFYACVLLCVGHAVGSWVAGGLRCVTWPRGRQGAWPKEGCRGISTRADDHDAVTLGDMCVGIPALLQGTIKLRRSAAARRLTASQSPGPHWTLLDPPCCPSPPTGNQCPVGSTHPPQPARGVPRVRDPEVVEGRPTRPICPPSDPVSCLPPPRDVVPAPLPYQDITHRTRNRLTTPLRVAGGLPSPLL